MVKGREFSVTDQAGSGAIAAEGAADAVDAMVAAIGPRLGAPTMQRRDVVLVTGPWLAGVSGVVAALCERLPEHTFIEPAELAAGEAPTAVVFVVSAAAALTESDGALLDAATTDTDAVIGVVSKIDVHRAWRDVLAADRDALSAHAPRYRDVPWVGVAALPERGEPRVDDLVVAVREQLADTDLPRRNRLRAWESRLQNIADRYDRDADGAGRRARVEALREQRSGILRQRRLSKSERTIALRSQTQQARVQLSYYARNRCASVRSELQEDLGSLTRRKLPEFEAYARGRIDEVVGEVDSGTSEHLADMAQGLGLPTGPSGTRRTPDDRDTASTAEVAATGDPVDDAGGCRFRIGRRVDAQSVVGRPGSRTHRGRGRRMCGDRPCAHRLGGRHSRPTARSRIAGPLGRRGDRPAAVRARAAGRDSGARN